MNRDCIAIKESFVKKIQLKQAWWIMVREGSSESPIFTRS
jgi:hypothetical protein